jgi:hypothetical protein
MLLPSSAIYGSSGSARRVSRIKAKIVAGVGV